MKIKKYATYFALNIGIALACFLLSGALNVAEATEYYVDQANQLASDANPGTEAQPFLSIDHALPLLNPGDTLLIKGSTDPTAPAAVYDRSFRDGIRSWRPGLPGAPITIASYPGDTVILQGGGGKIGLNLDNSSYHIFRGLIFRNYEKLSGGYTPNIDILIDTCEFTISTGTGLRINNVTNFTMRDSYVHHAFEAGISVGETSGNTSDNVLFERVESSYNDDHLGADGDGDGFRAEIRGTITFIDCTAIGNSEDAFDITANATLTRVVAGSSTACGIKFWRRSSDNYAEKTDTVTNSLVYGNGEAGVKVSAGASLNFYNNVVYGNGDEGVAFRGIGITQGPAVVNSQVVNNIIANNGWEAIEVLQSGPNTNHVVADHNLYYNSGQSNVGLAADTNAIAGQDPLFLNPANGDFHLKKGSPAIDAGLDLSSLGINIDIIGTSRPQDGDGDGIAKYDIGAYEYTPTTADSKTVLAHVNTPKFIVLTGNDAQGRNSMTPLATPVFFTIITPPQHGMLSGTVPVLTYMPILDYQGQDSFTFKANDGTEDSPPGTISINVAPWKPPIGIPEPEFGIEETVKSIYSDENYYTYYIDNTDPNATDTSNPKGTKAVPRKTIPYKLTLAPADVVVIVSCSSAGTGHIIAGGGSAAQPAFIRGISATDRPTITRDLIFSRASDGYIIVENLAIDGSVNPGYGSIALGGDSEHWEYPQPHHVAVRNCEILHTGSAIQIGNSQAYGTRVHDLVVYNNLIHDNGNWLAAFDEDRHGVYVGRGSENVLILDNEFYHNSGDGVQINEANDDPDNLNHIYVGRNVAHHNKQTGLWTKTANHVIFSQNVCYASHPVGEHPSDLPSGLGFQYGPENVWFLFNHIYDCDNGISMGSYYGHPAENVYLIGNVIHDIRHSTTDVTGLYPVPYVVTDPWSNGKTIRAWSQSATKYIIGNTIYNADGGIYSPQTSNGFIITNNIFANIGDGSGIPRDVFINNVSTANASELYNNLFSTSARITWATSTVYNVSGFQAAFPGVADGSFEADPKFFDPANNDFRLQADSPAIDKGIETTVFQTFYNLYGIDIKKDFDANLRPQGAGWDIGAYEYTPQGAGIYGDVNGDTRVDSLDVQACVNHILGTQDWSARADVNKDSAINALDIQAVVNIILGV